MKIGIYGSIRRGGALHPWVKDEQFVARWTPKIPYELRIFRDTIIPCIVPSDDLREIVFEVYDVTPMEFLTLARMELSAGYVMHETERDILWIQENTYTEKIPFFVIEDERVLSSTKPIESGDYIKHMEENPIA